MIEVWKPIPGHPGYDVSDHGRVRSYLTRQGSQKGAWRIAKKPQRVLCYSVDPSRGYFGVCLRVGGISFHRRVGFLVLLAFVGPRPKRTWVCHKDLDTQNDHLDNLMYAGPIELLSRIPKENRHKQGTRNFTNQEVIEIRERYSSEQDLTHADLARDYGVSARSIERACSGDTYPHLGGPRVRQKFQRRVPDETVLTILSRLEDEPARKLAAEFGIHESTISRWKSGSNRKGIVK